MSFDRIMYIRTAGSVQRYHTERMIRQQDVAAHSFGVAMILLHIYPQAPVHMLRAALKHDLSEIATGDIPAPVKWGSPQLKAAVDELDNNWRSTYQMHESLYDNEKLLLKWCDYIETALHSYEDRLMGNKLAAPIVRKIMKALSKMECPLLVKELYDEMKQRGLEQLT